MYQQMLSSLLSFIYCRREACKHASDRSLLCVIYITGCVALSSQGFLDGVTATGTFHPLLQRGKPVKDFSCFSTISQLPSQNLYYTTHGLAREDEGLLYAVEDEEWAWSTGLFIRSTQYPSGRRHSVGEATLIRTYSLAMRSLGDLSQHIYSKLRE